MLARFMVDYNIYEKKIRTNNMKIMLTTCIYLLKVFSSKVFSFSRDVYDQF